MGEIKYDFSNKTFVVVGASSGIGRCVSKELLESGASILAIARREKLLDELRIGYEEKMEYIAGDIRDIVELEKKIIVSNGARKKFDGLIFTAGTAGITPIRAFDLTLAKNIFEIGYFSAFSFFSMLLRKRLLNDFSSSIFLSSIQGYYGEKGMFAYSGGKAALRVAIKSVAKEIANKKHRINTVSPGWIETEMTANYSDSKDIRALKEKHLLGTGKCEDVSAVILFLLSNRAKWITGTDIIVDGGYST